MCSTRDPITQVELCSLFAEFINSHGLWPEFQEMVTVKGYTLAELGMSEDE